MWQLYVGLIFYYLNNFKVSCALYDIAANQNVISTKNYVFWPNATVPFYVNPEHFDHEQSLAILTALSMFAFKTCLKFAPVMTPPAWNEHVLVFMNPNGVRRCTFDTKGHSVFEPHMVTLGYNCLSSPNIDMMIMKALGFPFEHNRVSRDIYIDIMSENIEPGAVELFTRETLEPLEFKGLHYDVNSVTHFGNRDYSKNGHRTIIFKDPHIQQTRKFLTKTDLRKIEIIYGAECKDRDRREKIELCQSYPGVARKKRDIDEESEDSNEDGDPNTKDTVDYNNLSQSLRANRAIKVPKRTTVTYNSTVIENSAEDSLPFIMSLIPQISENAHKDLQEKYCKEPDESDSEEIVLDIKRINFTPVDTKGKRDRLKILEQTEKQVKAEIADILKSKDSLQDYCKKNQPLKYNEDGTLDFESLKLKLGMFRKFGCSFGSTDPRCPLSYHSTKNGPIYFSTKHRPAIYQSTKNYRVNNNYKYISMLRVFKNGTDNSTKSIEDNTTMDSTIGMSPIDTTTAAITEVVNTTGVVTETVAPKTGEDKVFRSVDNDFNATTVSQDSKVTQTTANLKDSKVTKDSLTANIKVDNAIKVSTVIPNSTKTVTKFEKEGDKKSTTPTITIGKANKARSKRETANIDVTNTTKKEETKDKLDMEEKTLILESRNDTIEEKEVNVTKDEHDINLNSTQEVKQVELENATQKSSLRIRTLAPMFVQRKAAENNSSNKTKLKLRRRFWQPARKSRTKKPSNYGQRYVSEATYHSDVSLEDRNKKRQNIQKYEEKYIKKEIPNKNKQQNEYKYIERDYVNKNGYENKEYTQSIEDRNVKRDDLMKNQKYENKYIEGEVIEKRDENREPQFYESKDDKNSYSNSYPNIRDSNTEFQENDEKRIRDDKRYKKRKDRSDEFERQREKIHERERYAKDISEMSMETKPLSNFNDDDMMAENNKKYRIKKTKYDKKPKLKKVDVDSYMSDRNANKKPKKAYIDRHRQEELSNEDLKTVKLSKQNKEFYNDRKWPGGIVRYILGGTITYDKDDVRARIKEVNDILKARTCIQLKEITEEEAEMYEDYLVLDNSPDYVTGKVGGRQNFGCVELLRGGQHRQHTAMMVMAMLGFYFEVSRHDRDKYIKVHNRHIRPDKLHHFEIIRSDATLPLPYDYNSATHPAWQFWRHIGKKGISTVATFKEVDADGSLMKSLGQHEKLLSDIDIVKINSVYGIKCFTHPEKD